ncbi:MAG: transaldolase family protein [bacterium]
MSEIKFLKWLVAETPTRWWHDSAIPDELRANLANGASGVTTNPVLVAASLAAIPDYWSAALRAVVPAQLDLAGKVEAVLECVTRQAAKLVEPVFQASHGVQGYACAQVNPRRPGDAEGMISMAGRLCRWAPNIAVKLPATAAGLDALEECSAQGITVTATVSFTLPQVLAIADRYQRGLARARAAGVKPGRCFAVVMVGRIDDYLRDVAEDARAAVTEADIIQGGTAIMKRAQTMFRERHYEAVLMPAGLRGAAQATELAGADMTLSIHPKIQALLAKLDGPFERRCEIPIEAGVLKRLSTIPEFVRAYEPDGMKPAEFIAYGVVQRTLSQFVECGWAPIEAVAAKL